MRRGVFETAIAIAIGVYRFRDDGQVDRSGESEAMTSATTYWVERTLRMRRSPRQRAW